ncbi:MAG: acyl-CoA dehydrogenase family protein [Actinomycetota bacterium]|nr:acyl-CoA dehydrogenase family protein [Actinomycetota bacterium]
MSQPSWSTRDDGFHGPCADLHWCGSELTVDFDFPPDDDPRRLAVRTWLNAHPNPSATELHGAGYVVPHWPAPYGIDADPMHQLLVDDELRVAGVSRPNNPIGIGWAAPTIMLAGTDEQKQRFLDPIFTGKTFFCQMFSEPDAGSDLANLSTRAERDGDEYVINGSKIWTSGGHISDYGILIARTNPDLPKHKGISYFICPTDLPGLTMSPIVDMTTAHSFNQVFFDDVRIPADLRIGEEGEGWRLTRVTLANERVSLSAAGSLWGAGPSAEDLLELIRRDGGCSDPLMRQKLAQLKCDAEVLRLNRLRTLSAQLTGRTPGAEASIQKLMADHHGQDVMELAKEYVGTSGLLLGSGPPGRIDGSRAAGLPTENNLDVRQFPDVSAVWHYGFIFSPALTLGGGTFAVQRNIVAERVLDLPRDSNVEEGKTWSEARRS